MLVLTRKIGEGIMIGDEIEIRVNRIEEDFVKIAIRAPRSLTIYRNEVYKQIKESNLGAVMRPDGEIPKLTLRQPAVQHAGGKTL
jgi:carbon storage regulator